MHIHKQKKERNTLAIQNVSTLNNQQNVYKPPKTNQLKSIYLTIHIKLYMYFEISVCVHVTFL